MALSDTKLRSLKPHKSAYQVADGGGLFVEVLPGGKPVWRLRYRLNGVQEKVTLGDYPSFTLGDARLWREQCKAAIARGESPMRAKQTAKATARFAAEEADGRETRTVKGFAEKWLKEVVDRDVRDPSNIKRALTKDVYPYLGRKRLQDVMPADILEITDRIKGRGSPAAALMTRNVLKRLFAFAIATHRVATNPAAAIEAKYIARPRKRERSLSMKELGQLLRAVYASDIRRIYKLTMHLLAITMVRKSELTSARWDEFDLDKALWSIPATRMKQGRAHVVPLSAQAVALLRELKKLDTDSEYVVPSRRGVDGPVSKSALNMALSGVALDVPDFVVHDFRRTASTHLNEAGFEPDVIEKALAHEQGGVRGIYNRAEYLEQRREMLQSWADLVAAAIAEKTNVVIGGFRKQA